MKPSFPPETKAQRREALLELCELVRDLPDPIVDALEYNMTEVPTDVKPGDIVRLKSGGPTMTVGMQVEHNGDKDAVVLHCVWYVDDQLQQAAIPAIALKTVRKLPSFTDLAYEAYTAYGDKAEWKNYAGSRMPSWQDLPDNI